MKGKYRIETARLARWDYRSRGWCFVTICTKDRRYLLGSIAEKVVKLTPAGLIAESEMEAIPQHYVNVIIDRFVVMPNHVLTIIVIEGEHQYSPDRIALPEVSVDTRAFAGIFVRYRKRVQGRRQHDLSCARDKRF